MIRAIAAACVIVFAGCAGSSKQAKPDPTANMTPEQKAQAEQDKKDEAKLVCVYERPTGSNIPEKVCRMPAQIEADREAAEKTMHSNPQVQTSKGN